MANFEGGGLISPDTALRILELATSGGHGNDLVMAVENSGSPIIGESVRQFEDSKPRMDIAGYFWGSQQRDNAGAGQNARSLSHMTVVRMTDAATASFASLMRVNGEAASVTISSYKSGGERISKDKQPTLEMVLEKVRMASHTLMTGGPLGMPTEILQFSFRRFTIRSAPQTETGQRGGVRECIFEVDNPQ